MLYVHISQCSDHHLTLTGGIVIEVRIEKGDASMPQLSIAFLIVHSFCFCCCEWDQSISEMDEILYTQSHRRYKMTVIARSVLESRPWMVLLCSICVHRKCWQKLLDSVVTSNWVRREMYSMIVMIIMIDSVTINDFVITCSSGWRSREHNNHACKKIPKKEKKEKRISVLRVLPRDFIGGGDRCHQILNRVSFHLRS